MCNLFGSKEAITVSKKGVLTLISFSQQRGRSDLHSYLNECISKTQIGTVLVHQKCRRDFTDQKRIQSCSNVDDEGPSPKRLRSSLIPFKWKDDCMICGKPAIVDARHPERMRVHRVSTLPIRGKISRVL